MRIIILLLVFCSTVNAATNNQPLYQPPKHYYFTLDAGFYACYDTSAERLNWFETKIVLQRNQILKIKAIGTMMVTGQLDCQDTTIVCGPAGIFKYDYRKCGQLRICIGNFSWCVGNSCEFVGTHAGMLWLNIQPMPVLNPDGSYAKPYGQYRVFVEIQNE